MEGHNAYPNTLISSHIQTRGKTHVDRVQQYRDMIDARRAAEKKAEEDKIAAKQARKQARAAAAKAAQIAKLKEEVRETFVSKAQPIEEILKQPYVEIDGWSEENKP